MGIVGKTRVSSNPSYLFTTNTVHVDIKDIQRVGVRGECSAEVSYLDGSNELFVSNS